MARYRGYRLGATNGFSLMELLVVIAILALVAGVSAARLSGSNETLILKTETRKIVAHLRATRSKSIAESRIYSIEAAETGAAYSITPGEESVKLPESIVLSLSTGATGPGQQSSEPSIAFYPDGSASGGSIILTGLSGQRSVTVNWMTGEVALVP